MKKFYTLVAAAAVAMSASAQLYLCGAGEGLDWEPATPMEVSAGADGNYTMTIKNLSQFKISTVKGTWDEFNAAALWADPKEDNLGQEIDLVAGDGNILMPWPGDYTVVVNADRTKAKFTTTTPKPVGPKKVYLRGSMNNWGNDPESLAQFEMQSEDGVTYWIHCTGDTKIPAGSEFKIADGDWGSVNYGADAEIVPDEFPQTWNYNANQGLMTDDYVGTISIVLPEKSMDPAEVTVYPGMNPVFGAVENVVVDANAPAEYFNLQGVRVYNPANGLYIVRRAGNVSKVIVK